MPTGNPGDIKLSANFAVNTAQYIDGRMTVAAVANLTTDFEYVPNGFECFVQDVKLWYQFIDNVWAVRPGGGAVVSAESLVGQNPNLTVAITANAGVEHTISVQATGSDPFTTLVINPNASTPVQGQTVTVKVASTIQGGFSILGAFVGGSGSVIPPSMFIVTYIGSGWFPVIRVPLNGIATDLQSAYDGGNVINGVDFFFNYDEGNVIAIGTEAADGNTADYVNALGPASAKDNEGSDVNAFGPDAARENTGNSVNAFGGGSATGNTGSEVNAFGGNSAPGNTGSDVNAFGRDSAQANEGDNVNAFGVGAASGNTLSGQTIFDALSLPSYADPAAAATAITVANGAVADSRYLYCDLSTGYIGFIIPT